MAGAREDRSKDPRTSENDPSRSAEELTRRNVERVSALEAAEHRKATAGDRIADIITNFSGSMTFVWLNVLSIAVWMVVNLALPHPRRFDPFPFSLLTLVLSVEAIFLAIFILISQNRAARISDKRSHLDLQLNLLSEQENTKMLLMLERIGNAVGAEIGGIPDVKVFEQATRPEALSEQIDQAAELDEQRKGRRG
ncbi:MAG TPA: DUF1003 domain-containing protein [Gemmatimonadales bacterium]|jgi:uncharacterized membrane protein|nr:DUF1003 domain-containing protein [Gemmatimonadales bacterium]